jgi:hypothetical protein
MNPALAAAQLFARLNIYEVRPEGDGFALLSGALEQRQLYFTKEHVAVGYATLHSRSIPSVIRVYDAAGKLLATHEQQARSEPMASRACVAANGTQ